MISENIIDAVQEDIDQLRKDIYKKREKSIKEIRQDIAELYGYLAHFEKFFEDKTDDFEFNPLYVIEELEKDIYWYDYQREKVSKQELKAKYDDVTDNFDIMSHRRPRHRMKRAVKMAEKINEFYEESTDGVIEEIVEKIEQNEKELKEKVEQCQFCQRMFGYNLKTPDEKELDNICAHCYIQRRHKDDGVEDFAIVSMG